ncbi:MAG TPA: tetratricopeptide repeat protein [Spirochaetota bacterium]|nr:tetratricopeptide repeat protein [Spirochaetota bacterium]HPI89085.1 tetratricopeptide repeat protein [Spirochaetota bacterium]HPR48704.1 tetratricopeptide repeat protein [Spirochaetota bacterium]
MALRNNIKNGAIIKSLQIAAALLFVIPLLSAPLASYDEVDRLEELLRIARENPVEEKARENIYLKDDILYCTGTGRAARENNRAASFMESGEYRKAADIFESSLAEAALFFPFRYNLGTCYVRLLDLKRAMLNFQKAKLVVPEFSKTYLQIGLIYQQWDRDSEAIEYFREALRRNIKELETFVMIGDVYFKRNQLEMAQKYFDTVLRVDHRYPNALLGRGKIYFRRGQYIKAIVMLKSIDTSRPYDKALHYYFAESSFKLRDYRTAAEHYDILLKNRNDRFFLTNSPALIKHKLEISRRLATRE